MLFNSDRNRFTEVRAVKSMTKGQQGANCPGCLISWGIILVIFKRIPLRLKVEVRASKIIHLLSSRLSGMASSF